MTDDRRRPGARATRVEALTDAVFAFAITLLVVTLEVPDTFDDLLATRGDSGSPSGWTSWTSSAPSGGPPSAW